jgi:predicted nucleotidyltransferase
MLSQTDQKIVQELKARLQEVAGEQVQAVIVYGSRVWGQAGPDSDLDVAVIIQGLYPGAGKCIAGSRLPGHVGPRFQPHHRPQGL